MKEPKSARARANERLLGHIKQYWLESGGSGYVSKGADTEELSQAIRTVAGGEFYISQDVAQNIALEVAIVPTTRARRQCPALGRTEQQD